jgi:hypothetical protein
VRNGLDIAYLYGLAVHLHGSKTARSDFGPASCCSRETLPAPSASPPGTRQMPLPRKQRHSPKRLTSV